MKMLKIKVIVVDRTRSSFLKEGESFYLDRLRRYTRLEWIEVKPVKIKKGRSREEVLSQEGKAIIRRLSTRDHVIPLDRSGRQYDSQGLSRWLDRLATQLSGQPSFIIGGPLGLAKEVFERAQGILSLSKLTLTHEMSRLLFLEQLYRAFTILRGEKYHKL